MWQLLQHLTHHVGSADLRHLCAPSAFSPDVAFIVSVAQINQDDQIHGSKAELKAFICPSSQAIKCHQRQTGLSMLSSTKQVADICVVQQTDSKQHNQRRQ
jgi:ureidoglycolate hydrolase